MKKVNKVQLVCCFCNKFYLTHPYRIKTSRFCSASCHGKYRINQQKDKFFRDKHGKNHPMWGKHLSQEWKKKISKNHADLSGEKNVAWKGEGAKYGTNHDWIYRQLGSPQK